MTFSYFSRALIYMFFLQLTPFPATVWLQSMSFQLRLMTPML